MGTAVRSPIAVVAALAGIHLFAGLALWVASPMFLRSDAAAPLLADPPGDAWLVYTRHPSEPGQSADEANPGRRPILSIGDRSIAASSAAPDTAAAFDSRRLPPDTVFWIETPSTPMRASLYATEESWPGATGVLEFPNDYSGQTLPTTRLLPLEVEGTDWVITAQSMAMAINLYEAADAWSVATRRDRLPWRAPDPMRYWMHGDSGGGPASIGAMGKHDFVVAAPGLLRQSNSREQDPLAGAVPMEWEGVRGHALLPGPWGNQTVVARTRGLVCVASRESLMPPLLDAVRKARRVSGTAAHVSVRFSWWYPGPEHMTFETLAPVMRHPRWNFDLTRLAQGSFRIDAYPGDSRTRQGSPPFAGELLTSRPEATGPERMPPTRVNRPEEVLEMRAGEILSACKEGRASEIATSLVWDLVRQRAGGSGAPLAYLTEDAGGRRAIGKLLHAHAALECACERDTAPEAWTERLAELRLEIAASLVGSECCLDDFAKEWITDGLPSAVADGLRTLPECEGKSDTYASW